MQQYPCLLCDSHGALEDVLRGCGSMTILVARHFLMARHFICLIRQIDEKWLSRLIYAFTPSSPSPSGVN